MNITNRSTSRTRRATRSSEQPSPLKNDQLVESGSRFYSNESQKAHHGNIISATGANECKIIPACLPTPTPSALNFPALFRADIV